MKAAIYARVSTDRQAEKYGIPSQIEALRKRCLEKDWTLVFDGDKDAFIDDGYSGAELDRPALNRLRKTAGEGRVDVVLAYDPDRLSRKLSMPSTWPADRWTNSCQSWPCSNISKLSCSAMCRTK